MSSAMQALRPPLERARRAWRASPLPAFLHWWGGELAALLPAGWRQRFGGGADWFVLARDGGEWRVRRAGEPVAAAAWPADDPASSQRAALDAAVRGVDAEDLRLALLLPAAQVLRRALSLPQAAADNLMQVGAFEMDRQTPFRAEQVYYAMRELPKAAAPGRFAAELLAVPRAALDPLLAQLQSAGIAVDAVDVAEGAGRLGVNLLPPVQAPRRSRPRLRLNLALGAACAVLLALALMQWLHNREQALEQMRDEVASLRAQAQAVASLRQQWQDNVGAAGFLVQRKQRSTSRLALLLELTQRLPASAWLERFSLDNAGQLGFQGQAQQAVKLIDAMKDSPLIADPNFQGSIQPDPSSGKDRFYMLARLRQPAAAPAAQAPLKPAAGGAP